MEFHERLDFLLDTTRTNNKDLAEYCHTSPSTISFLRTGARKMPKQTAKIEQMADFFSQHISTASQRTALADCIGLISLRRELPEEALSSILYQWLIGQDIDMLSMIADKFNSPYSGRPILPIDEEDEVPITTPTKYFPGRMGKLNALKLFFKDILDSEEPGEIYYFSSEAPDWIINNSTVYSQVLNYIYQATQKGFVLHHVMQPFMDEAKFYEIINMWIPLYLAGNIHMYYYPRYRNSIHKRSLWLYPGHCSVASNSIIGQEYSPFAIYTSDSFLVNCHYDEIKLFLEQCEPALNVYTEKNTIISLIKNILYSPIPRMQKGISLSIWTMPFEEILKNLTEKYPQEATSFSHAIVPLIDFQKAIPENCSNLDIIDICPLATAEQVKAGIVPISMPLNPLQRTYYYTPELYIAHLENIIQVIEKSDTYKFCPIPFTPKDELSVLIQKNQKAIIIRSSDIRTVHEVIQPQLLLHLQEYLLQVTERNSPTSSKNKTIDLLKQTIQKLRN